jgi:5'-nucleotidase
MMKEPKTILIDMDGVIVDYNPSIHGTDDSVDFASLKPIEHAIETIKELMAMGHDVFIATTAPWGNPKSWMDKRLWIGEHLPELHKRIFMTHRKDMLIGDYLIDDRPNNGAQDFKGEWIHFGQDKFPDWKSVKSYFLA